MHAPLDLAGVIIGRLVFLPCYCYESFDLHSLVHSLPASEPWPSLRSERRIWRGALPQRSCVLYTSSFAHVVSDSLNRAV